MGSVFQRVANWLANELLGKALANNKTFQQFALKTVQKGQSVQKAAQTSAQKLATSKATTDTAKGLRGVLDWVKEDLKKVGTKPR